MMELTTTQNGALYTLQHSARNNHRRRRRIWRHANEIIRTAGQRFWPGRKIKREKVWFI
jgi:hypothetical protein